jgi:hypothetical protein
MTRAARGAHAFLTALALATAAAPTRARAAEAPETIATKQDAPRSAAYPLVLLAQVDGSSASEPEGPALAGGNDPASGWTARLRRLRVGEDLRLGDWQLRAMAEAQYPARPFTPAEGGRLAFGGDVVRLTEAFVAWIPHRAYQLTLGAQRVPFSLSRQVDEADLRMPERAQVIAALAPDYRVGLAFTSDLGLLNLRMAGMSAARTLDSNLFDSGYLGAMRLGTDPIGPMGVAPWRRGARLDDPWYGWWRFSGGMSVLYGTLLAPRTLGLGADAQLQWLRFTLTGEYVGEYLTSGGGWAHQGAVLEPGLFVWSQRLELVARGSWYRRPSTVDPDDRTDTFAAGGGLTFFALDARVRLQAAFEARRTRGALLADQNWAIFRVTFAL